MSRIIKTDNPSTERNRAIREIVYALNYGLSATLPQDEYKDIALYIVHLLAFVNQTVSITVEAWEKRGYWLKADKFQYEWSWIDREIASLSAGLNEPPGTVIFNFQERTAGLAQQLKDNKLPKKQKDYKPWKMLKG